MKVYEAITGLLRSKKSLTAEIPIAIAHEIETDRNMSAIAHELEAARPYFRKLVEHQLETPMDPRPLAEIIRAEQKFTYPQWADQYGINNQRNFPTFTERVAANLRAMIADISDPETPVTLAAGDVYSIVQALSWKTYKTDDGSLTQPVDARSEL